MQSSKPLGTLLRGVGIVASLAVVLLAVAVVVPGEDPSRKVGRLNRAIADIRLVASAFTEWARSGDAAPAAKLGAEPEIWYGSGALPKSTFVNDGVRWPLRDVLVDGAHARLDHVPADPWGNAYVVLRVHDGCWKILSAGPDGVLDTTPSTPEESAGDDIGGWIVR